MVRGIVAQPKIYEPSAQAGKMASQNTGWNNKYAALKDSRLGLLRTTFVGTKPNYRNMSQITSKADSTAAADLLRIREEIKNFPKNAAVALGSAVIDSVMRQPGVAPNYKSMAVASAQQPVISHAEKGAPSPHPNMIARVTPEPTVKNVQRQAASRILPQRPQQKQWAGLVTAPGFMG